MPSGGVPCPWRRQRYGAREEHVAPHQVRSGRPRLELGRDLLRERDLNRVGRQGRRLTRRGPQLAHRARVALLGRCAVGDGLLGPAKEGVARRRRVQPLARRPVGEELDDREVRRVAAPQQGDEVQRRRLERVAVRRRRARTEQQLGADRIAAVRRPVQSCPSDVILLIDPRPSSTLREQHLEHRPVT